MSVSLEEYVAVLKRSSSPTLIVEGDDDYVAFREFEVENVQDGFTVFPVFGKENILSIIERRNEIENQRLAFLLDQDEWCLLGAGAFEARDDVILTDGWSIENDLLRDGELERLMSPDEREKLLKEINEFSRLFAAALHCHLNKVDGPRLSTHPNEVLDGLGNLKAEVIPQMIDPYDCGSLMDQIAADRMRFIRGKSLLQIFIRQLSRSGRASRYSYANLLEMCAAFRGQNLTQLEQKTRDALLVA